MSNPADGFRAGTNLPCLDDIGKAVFRQALERGVLDQAAVADALSLSHEQVREATRTLLALRLLQGPKEDEDGPLVPVDPRAATSEVAADFERGVRLRRDEVGRTLESVQALAEEYDRATSVGTVTGCVPGVQILTDVEQVRDRLRDEARRCCKEALTAQPGGARSPSTLSEALPRDIGMIERGVQMRVLYQHTARVNLTTQAYSRAVIDAGAEVRTLGELTDRLIIFDRAVAFVPARAEAEGPPGAVVVTEPYLVHFLCSVYDRMWHAATPFNPEASGYEEITDDLRRLLLRCLAAGMKDEVIARRLGMSVRTCRRHIAELMQYLQAGSRFQAGYAAARMGWIDAEPGTPSEF
ncbi:LuxR C-terminal-related transcriptional regulator [Streptomyces sp. NPDC003233]